MTTETPVERHEFQAEVKQLLNIVIHSLYTDREIFIRELVSNASDALEKMRHLTLTESIVNDAASELTINIQAGNPAPVTDPKENDTPEDNIPQTSQTITFTDTGLGMSREELTQNLGTIAHSGTKAFLQQLSDDKKKSAGVIGQFGVGFYAAFMVAEKVEVYTRSWRENAQSLCWESSGDGSYEIREVDEQPRGTRIVITLKDDATEFSQPYRVRNVLQTYSQFVSFPVLLNGERVNTVEPLWTKNRTDITPEQYKEFYQFTTHAMDEPSYTFHFQSETPIEINTLFFVPGDNQENQHMGPYTPAVALHCKRVLIDPNPAKLLPEWLRFLKGVIDSPDLPLNISRETMQDSSLLRKITDVVVKRFLKFLASESEQNPEKYFTFYRKFHRFLKEGVIMDYAQRDNLTKLLRFESTMTDQGQPCTLADYVARMKDGQEEIYYLLGSDRKSLEAGPYLEAFHARGYEVIFLTDGIDEYLAQHLTDFEGKPLKSAANADLKLPNLETSTTSIPADAMDKLNAWAKNTLGDAVDSVTASDRLIDSPAMILTKDDGMGAQMRRMMKAMNQEVPEPPKPDLALNPRHALVRKLSHAHTTDAELASNVLWQIFDSSLMSAGLLEDTTALLRRNQALLERVLPDPT